MALSTRVLSSSYSLLALLSAVRYVNQTHRRSSTSLFVVAFFVLRWTFWVVWNLGMPLSIKYKCLFEHIAQQLISAITVKKKHCVKQSLCSLFKCFVPVKYILRVYECFRSFFPSNYRFSFTTCLFEFLIPVMGIHCHENAIWKWVLCCDFAVHKHAQWSELKVQTKIRFQWKINYYFAINDKNKTIRIQNN